MTIDLDAFLPYRLDRISDVVSRHLQPVYRAEYGMTRPEWKVLAHLGREKSLTARHIVRLTGLHKTKVSRAVAALEARRWLTRDRDEKDGRVEHLSLTPLGRKSYETLAVQLKQREATFLAQLNERERETIDSALVILEKISPQNK